MVGQSAAMTFHGKKLIEQRSMLKVFLRCSLQLTPQVRNSPDGVQLLKFCHDTRDIPFNGFASVGCEWLNKHSTYGRSDFVVWG
jgi:hypothetical protein